MSDAVLVGQIRAAVADRLADRVRGEGSVGGQRLDADGQRTFGRELINEQLDVEVRRRMAEGVDPLDEAAEDAIADEVFNSLFGLGRLEPYLADETIENILVNGCDRVFVVRADGSKERGQPVAATDAELIDLVKTAAAREGRSERRFDLANPHLNLRLRDGSRLFAAMEVCDRPSISIRRHRYSKVDLSEMEALGTIDRALSSFLAAAVRARRNIVVCGGTDVGKTTFLRSLISAINPSERLVTIEDSAELDLAADPDAHPDVIEFEQREPNIEGEGLIDMADLTRMALRMAPDRVIVGEVRGAEVLPMLLAMSQGNDGSLCTLHADSSSGAFAKIAMYAVMAPERLPLDATNLLIANSVHFVVHLRKQPEGTRVVSSVREVVGAEGQVVSSNEVFRPGDDGRAVPGAPLRDTTLASLRACGLDDSLLHEPRGWWQ